MKMKINFESFINFCFSALLVLISFFSFGLAAKWPFNYVTIALWACLGILFLVQHRCKKPFYPDLFFWIIFLFVVVQCVSFVTSGFRKFPFTTLTIAMANLLLYEFVLDRDFDKANYFNLVCFGCIAFLILFGIIYRYEIFHPTLSAGNRIGTYFDNQNNVGRSMASMAILLFFSCLKNRKVLIKLLFGFFSFVSFYFLLLTGSVSSLATLVVVFLISVPLLFKKRRALIAFLEIGLLAFVLFSLFSIPSLSYFAERIKGMLSSLGFLNGRGDGSFEERLGGALVGFRIFLQYPLTGNGIDAVYNEYFITAHNNFSEVLADFGIFGFMAEEALFVIPMVAFVKKKWKNGIWFFPCLLFFFLFQFFLLSYNSKPDNLILTLCFASAFPNGFYPSCLEKRVVSMGRANI